MDRDEALRQVYDYIDGELNGPDRQAFESAIAADPFVRQQVEAERRFRELMVSRIPRPVMPVEVRQRLFARLASEGMPSAATAGRPEVNRMGLWRFAVAASLLLGLAIASAWMSGTFGRDSVNWRALAQSHHHRYPGNNELLATADYSDARDFVVSRLGTTAESLLPASSPASMGTIAASVEPWENSWLAHLEMHCQVNGRISLFAIPASSIRLIDQPPLRVDGRLYQSATLGCCKCLCWQESGEYVCALVGDCDMSGLLAVAERWRSACTSRVPDK